MPSLKRLVGVEVELVVGNTGTVEDQTDDDGSGRNRTNAGSCYRSGPIG